MYEITLKIFSFLDRRTKIQIAGLFLLMLVIAGLETLGTPEGVPGQGGVVDFPAPGLGSGSRPDPPSGRQTA